MANNKDAFSYMATDDPGSEMVPQKRRVTLPAMLMAGAKSPTNPMQGVLNYLNETPLNEKDYKYLRERAALIGSDEWTAMMPFTAGIFSIDNLITGKRGAYHGQDRGRSREEEDWLISQTGLKRSPHLLDVYLGNTTAEAEGLKKIEGTDSYDANSYIKFVGFDTGEQGGKSKLYELKKDVTRLQPEGHKYHKKLNLSDYGITPVTYETIDFGRKSWQIEKGKDGITYLTMDDKWDFAGSDYGATGKIMDKLGAKDINLRVKIPLGVVSWDRDDDFFGRWTTLPLSE